MQIPSWNPVANGVWRTTIGSTLALDLLSQSGVAPRMEGLAALPEQPIPLLPEAITVGPAGDKLVLTLPLDRAEKLYGLGLNFTSIEVQQTVRHLHVDHFGGKDNGRTHAPRSGERVDLEVRHYGAAAGAFDLYDDDGETYDHEQGACSWPRLRVDRSAEGVLVGTFELISGLDAATYGAMTWQFMS